MDVTTLSQKIESLPNTSFRNVDDLQKRIAKATKTSPKKLTSGSRTFTEFCMALAKQLVKPSCKDVLQYAKTTLFA